ncbi:hypothetical protein GGR56DRAFT_114892 [Xylariaceae sp. FL0804]|nr:hypothetical protein GGR56DRAFT_114892 [Xylariaceae sp. FL0804]
MCLLLPSRECACVSRSPDVEEVDRAAAAVKPRSSWCPRVLQAGGLLCAGGALSFLQRRVLLRPGGDQRLRLPHPPTPGALSLLRPPPTGGEGPRPPKKAAVSAAVLGCCQTSAGRSPIDGLASARWYLGSLPFLSPSHPGSCWHLIIPHQCDPRSQNPGRWDQAPCAQADMI